MPNPIRRLYLKNFRNHAELKLVFESACTILTGGNGRGKTNVLEAVFFLSILRSFRAAGVREMLRIGMPAFTVLADIERGGEIERLKIEQSLSSRRLFIDGVPMRRASDFIREFRAVAFAPEDKRIASGSSGNRRRFFDMFISVQQPEYLAALQAYSAALASRNAALKKSRSASGDAVIAAFEPILAENAAVIRRCREFHAVQLAMEARALLADTGEFDIAYQADYPADPGEYLEALRTGRDRDRRRSCTSFGPQLDEFKLTLDGRLLRSYGSTGQMRLVSLYLKMAELNLVRRAAAAAGARVVALVDDVTGELDAANRERFFRTVTAADQTIFTFTEMPGDRFFRDAAEIPIAGEENDR